MRRSYNREPPRLDTHGAIVDAEPCRVVDPGENGAGTQMMSALILSQAHWESRTRDTDAVGS